MTRSELLHRKAVCYTLLILLELQEDMTLLIWQRCMSGQDRSSQLIITSGLWCIEETNAEILILTNISGSRLWINMVPGHGFNISESDLCPSLACDLCLISSFMERIQRDQSLISSARLCLQSSWDRKAINIWETLTQRVLPLVN